MPRRKNRFTLEQTPIAVRVRVMVGNDNKTFYVMRYTRYGWRKTMFKGGRGFRWETRDYDEALIVLEQELCRVLTRRSAACLAEPIVLVENLSAILG